MTALLLIGILFAQSAPAAQTAGGTLVGRLSFADASPVPGITVVAIPVPPDGQPAGNSGRGAATDASGVFRVTNLNPGRYFLRIGNAPSAIYYPGVRTTTEATVVTVTAGTAAIEVEFVLPTERGVRVGGRVTGSSTAAPDGRNPIVQLSGGNPFQSLRTDVAQDGTFQFDGVRAGSYALIVPNVPGMQPARISVSGNLDGVELKLPRLVTVSGEVLVEGSSARPPVVVRFDGTVRKDAAAQPGGGFNSELPEGFYRLMLERLPEGYYVKSITAGAANLLTGPFKITEADEAVRVQLVLGSSPGVRVRGRLVLTGPITDATLDRLVLTGASTTETTQVPVDSDGSFQIARLMPGTYIARVPVTPTVSSPPIVVEIPAEDVDDIEIPVPAPQEIPGEVVVAGDGQPPKFSLLLIRDGDVPGETESAALGPDALAALMQEHTAWPRRRTASRRRTRWSR